MESRICLILPLVIVRLRRLHAVLTVESGKFELIGRTGNVGADTRSHRAWCLLSCFRPMGLPEPDFRETQSGTLRLLPYRPS